MPRQKIAPVTGESTLTLPILRRFLSADTAPSIQEFVALWAELKIARLDDVDFEVDPIRWTKSRFA